MQSKAATVAQYLASLPDDRRAAIERVRKVFLDNMQGGYAEGMQYGMIGYYVPHTLFPPGYHCDPNQPLPFASLGSQKNHMAVYLMCIYGHEGHRAWFEKAWKAAGKKLDMGKACIRFKKLDDLALDVLAEAIRRVPVNTYVEHYLAARDAAASGKAGREGRPAKKRILPKKKAAAKKKAPRPGAKKKSRVRS